MAAVRAAAARAREVRRGRDWHADARRRAVAWVGAVAFRAGSGHR